jgi:hypothetical protein
MDRVGVEPTTSAEIIVVFTLIGITIRATEEIFWQGIYTRILSRSKFFAFIPCDLVCSVAYRTSVYHAKSICWRSRLLSLSCFTAWNIGGICCLENWINTVGRLSSWGA